MREDPLDLRPAERRAAPHAEQPLAQPRRGARMRVALRRADRHARGVGDLLERVVEAGVQDEHLRLVAGESRRAPRRARARSSRPRPRAPGRRRGPTRRSSSSGSQRRALALRDVLAGVDDRAGAARSRTATRRGTAGCARRASRATPAPRRARPRGRGGRVRQPLDARRVPLAERREGARVAVFRSSAPGSDRSASRRRAAGPPAALDRSDGSCARRLHGGRSLVAVPLDPDAVRPLLRGCFGRERYRYAESCASTQRLRADDAPHGTVARRRAPDRGPRPARPRVDRRAGRARCSARSSCGRRAPVRDWPS